MRFKRPALQRRILRRMALCKCETLPDYITYISRSWEEVAILQNEFLVASPVSFAIPTHGRRWRRSSCRSFSATVPAAGAR